MRMFLAVAAAFFLAAAAGPASMSADEAYARAVTYFESRFTQMAAAEAEKTALQTAQAQSLKAQLAAAKKELEGLKIQAAAADQKASQALQAFAAGDGAAGLDAIEAAARGAQGQALAQWMRLGALAFPVDTRRAVAAYEEALKLSPNDGEATARLAALLVRQGRGAEAAERAQTLIDSEIPALKVDGLILSAEAYRIRGSLLLAEGRAAALVGRLAQAQGNAIKAEANLKDALALLTQVGDREDEASARMSLGAAFALRQMTAAAEAEQKKALALYEGLGDRAGEAAALAALGETARVSKLYLIAEGYLRRSQKIARAIEALSLQAVIALRLGQSADGRGARPEACLHFRQAQGLLLQTGYGVGPEAETLKTGLARTCA